MLQCGSGELKTGSELKGVVVMGTAGSHYLRTEKRERKRGILKTLSISYFFFKINFIEKQHQYHSKDRKPQT